jgi:hypothetical protein
MNNGIVSKKIEGLKEQIEEYRAMGRKLYGRNDSSSSAYYNMARSLDAQRRCLESLLKKHPELDHADIYKKQRDELLAMVKGLQHMCCSTDDSFHSMSCDAAQALLRKIEK